MDPSSGNYFLGLNDDGVVGGAGREKTKVGGDFWLMGFVWANFALCSNCVGGGQAQYYPHSYKWSKEAPGPISGVKENKYPRTASRRMDKITVRGEVEHTYEESGRVRGRWSLRDFCPRYLVNSLITQNNAWDKPYNKAKGEISNKG